MKPLLVHYYLTNRCNAKCSFCDIWRENPKINASTQQVLENLVQARSLGCKFVDFTGGEPLLHEDLPLFLEKAKELGFITSVTTNTLLFVQKVKKLDGLIDLLHFSIDGDSAAVHDTLRGVASYDKVMESIPVALSNNLVPDLLFTYTDSNIDNFLGVYETARKYKIMLILDPLFTTHGNDEVAIETHKKALQFAKLPGVYLNKAHLVLRKMGGNHCSKTFCKAVSTTLVILPNNSLALPCYHNTATTIPLEQGLRNAFFNPIRRLNEANQGTHSFCEGCHINCYFDPSFTFLFNTLSLWSFKAKLEYFIQKYLIYKRPFPKRLHKKSQLSH